MNLVNENVFEKLGDDLLLLIFGFLPRKTLGLAAQVSKRWKQVSNSGELWRSVTFHYEDRVTTSLLDACLDRGCLSLGLIESKVQRPLWPGPNLGPTAISYMLEAIELSYVTMDMSDLLRIIGGSKNLKHLVLSVFNVSFNDDFCDMIAKNDKMETIKGASGSDLSWKGLFAIARGCKRLVECNINTYKREFTTSESELTTLVAELPATIKIFKNFVYNVNFSDDHLKLLISKLPNLENLCLEGCNQISLEAVKNLHKLPQLRKLFLSNVALSGNRDELEAQMPGVELHFI